MGEVDDDLKAKIEEMEEINTAGRKFVNVKEFQKRKERLKEETYIWFSCHIIQNFNRNTGQAQPLIIFRLNYLDKDLDSFVKII